MSFKQRLDIRNIAIIAHVDHGKTTLVDQMLRQSGTLDLDKEAEMTERVMDSGDLERERGITILAKNTAICLPNMKINIVDTPGHMDFGGEVERTLQMVEGFLLLVDAAEGPLPGTRFVLQKALQLNLKPIVIINKIDRKDADIERTEHAIHELFLDLATSSEQLDFPILYGSSRQGFMSTDPTRMSGDLTPLTDAIIKYIPVPTAKTDDLRILITNLDHSDYLGRIAIGRVFSGNLSLNKQVIACKNEFVGNPVKIIKMYVFSGVRRVEVPAVDFGEIIAIAGVDEDITIGTTICDVGKPDPIPYVEIDEPTLAIEFSVNNSPFAGREGKLLTSRHIRDRLAKEIRTNLALRVEDTDSPDTFKVSGRGQLHLGILVETMRREGFELQLSAPEVIYKTINGERYEPYELLTLDIQDEHQGILMENLGQRRAILQNMIHHDSGKIRLEFKIPARGLLGFRGQFMTDTRGTGLMNHRFFDYEPYAGDIPSRTKGAMVSMEAGVVTPYALDGLQPRGILFAAPTEEVYEGMIVGEHSRENDLDVNPTKKKKLTNMRAAGSDDAVKLAPPRIMTLEAAMDWINPDELIEVTPVSIRLRKLHLKAHERKRSGN
jgi:GTP-binding protein